MKKISVLLGFLFFFPVRIFAAVTQSGYLLPDISNPSQQNLFIDPDLFASATLAADLQSYALLAGIIVAGLLIYSIVTAIG